MSWANSIEANTETALKHLPIRAYSAIMGIYGSDASVLKFYGDKENVRKILEGTDEVERAVISYLEYVNEPQYYFSISHALEKHFRLDVDCALDRLERKLLVTTASPMADAYQVQKIYTLNSDIDFSPIVSDEFMEEVPDGRIRMFRFRECVLAAVSLMQTASFPENVGRIPKFLETHKLIQIFHSSGKEEIEELFRRLYYAVRVTSKGGLRALPSLSDEEITAYVNEYENGFSECASKCEIGTCELSALLSGKSLGLSHMPDNYLFSLRDESKESEFSISGDMTVSFTRSPETSTLHLFATAECVDVLLSYRITKESIKSAYLFGLTLNDILSFLEGHGTVPTVVSDRIGEWYEDASSISVIDCYALKANERASRLIKASEKMGRHIISEPAEGLFLLKKDNEDEWRKTLIDLGMALPKKKDAREERTAMSLPCILTPRALPKKPRLEDRGNKQALLSYIDSLGMDEKRKAGYMNRIEKGYIVSKEQIDPKRDAVEIREATSLDQGMKSSLIKALCEEGSLCHITLKHGERIHAKMFKIVRSGVTGAFECTNYDTGETSILNNSQVISIAEDPT